MIISTNRFASYLNNLRILTSLSILKHGLQTKHLKNLKKIYLAEAFLYKDFAEPINLKLLSFNLLSSVRAVKENFTFNCSLYENYFLNKKLYVALLLLLSQNTNHLSINYKHGILIKGTGKINNALSVIKQMKAHYFYEIKTQNYLIFLPTTSTRKPSVQIESEWHFLFDEFSVLNLFLSHL